MGTPGVPELLLILGIFVLFFGVERLPKIARALGQAKGEFNEGMSDSRRGETEADLDRGGQTETAAISTEADVEGMTVDEARVAVEEE